MLSFAKNKPMTAGMAWDSRCSQTCFPCLKPVLDSEFCLEKAILTPNSYTVIQASRGKLGEDSLKEWAQKKEDVMKGFSELKAFLTKPADAEAV